MGGGGFKFVHLFYYAFYWRMVTHIIPSIVVLKSKIQTKQYENHDIADEHTVTEHAFFISDMKF